MYLGPSAPYSMFRSPFPSIPEDSTLDPSVLADPNPEVVVEGPFPKQTEKWMARFVEKEWPVSYLWMDPPPILTNAASEESFDLCSVCHRPFVETQQGEATVWEGWSFSQILVRSCDNCWPIPLTHVRKGKFVKMSEVGGSS